MNREKLRQLIANCRRSRERFVGRPPGRPSDWCPHKIQNPDMPPGYMFTDESAWEFIAQHLESEHPIEEVALEVPAGAPAIIMIIPLRGNPTPLYVKVEVGASCKAIGRSFHLSYRQGP